MTNGKKILYIGNKLASRGRTPTSIDTLGKLLEGEGYIVSYASDHVNPVLRLADMLLSLVKFRESDFVLIDTYSTKAFNYAWLSAGLASLLKLDYIPILHGGNMPDRFRRSPYKCRQIFGRSLTNVAVSGYLEGYLKKDQYKNCQIPNSIDLTQYPFQERTTFKPNLLWVRSFHSIYNPQLAVRLIAKLLTIFPDARLTMVGPDKDGSLSQCKEMAEELGVHDKVVFTGKLTKEEWIHLAGQHDIFINTATVDNTPVSLIEAMALGLPVISTEVGGISFLVGHEETGFLVPSGDFEAMYLSVERIVNESGLGFRIAKNARAKAEQFDWSHIRHRWFDILKKA